MSFTQLFFSPNGRISRKTYWLKYVLPVTLLCYATILIDVIAGTISAGFGIFSLVFGLITLYPSIAVGIKRCHDRNRSGWFLLLGVVPLLNIWLIIELGFLQGTIGDNKYGTDPLSA
ncbi:MAG: DUF805 domain-containing protein [Candidatus Auribacterota bacterium]|jgi:uncharacterized membrane protein YhaH (DUF805 family)|uniref:DUF805 domain-containing protein n=1 Tax=Candidatus Auribacter fodinae TaxID=2093366 RepID=A0A3A4RFW2_9BACT|nr:MAG: DUF805 domain-containing protein [Candidatus Auribacter fodinae]